MGTTGAQNPTAGATIAGAGVDWTDPGNVLASDGSKASAVVTVAAPASDYLKADGFNLETIPDDAAIDSVIVKVEQAVTGVGSAVDGDVELWTGDTTGTRIGDDKAIGTDPGATDVVRTYTWTASQIGALTLAQIRDPNFGVAFKGDWVSGTATYVLDHVTMEVTFTPALADLRGRDRSRGRPR